MIIMSEQLEVLLQTYVHDTGLLSTATIPRTNCSFLLSFVVLDNITAQDNTCSAHLYNLEYTSQTKDNTVIFAL